MNKWSFQPFERDQKWSRDREIVSRDRDLLSRDRDLVSRDRDLIKKIYMSCMVFRSNVYMYV